MSYHVNIVRRETFAARLRLTGNSCAACSGEITQQPIVLCRGGGGPTCAAILYDKSHPLCMRSALNIAGLNK